MAILKTPDRATDAAARAAVAAHLEDARRYTADLVAPLGDADLTRQISPLQSPLVWDLAHIAHFEELWLVREVGGGGPTDARFDDVYDASAHPRNERSELDLLEPRDARSYAAEVRRRALETIAAIDLGGHDPLLRDGFVAGLVVQHELQHAETMAQTLQLATDLRYRRLEQHRTGGIATPRIGEVMVEQGPFLMGATNESWAYDNEGRAHTVELEPFWIDAAPVTNRDYAAFVAAGGYTDRSLWSDAGWTWLRGEDAHAPLYWVQGSAGWIRIRLGWLEPLPLDEPVQHVSFHEAEAYARAHGRRLPTEAEWEKAATWSRTGAKLRNPWGGARAPGRANVGRVRFAPAPVGTYRDGVSPSGCHQMIGDVWEWTATEFRGYPGFEAFPYREYSEVFFGGGYRVLRGGSWATHPLVARATFRNWDHPHRRQIFAGFRTARDA